MHFTNLLCQESLCLLKVRQLGPSFSFFSWPLLHHHHHLHLPFPLLQEQESSSVETPSAGRHICEGNSAQVNRDAETTKMPNMKIMRIHHNFCDKTIATVHLSNLHFRHQRKSVETLIKLNITVR